MRAAELQQTRLTRAQLQRGRAAELHFPLSKGKSRQQKTTYAHRLPFYCGINVLISAHTPLVRRFRSALFLAGGGNSTQRRADDSPPEQRFTRRGRRTEQEPLIPGSALLLAPMKEPLDTDTVLKKHSSPYNAPIHVNEI